MTLFLIKKRIMSYDDVHKSTKVKTTYVFVLNYLKWIALTTSLGFSHTCFQQDSRSAYYPLWKQKSKCVGREQKLLHFLSAWYLINELDHNKSWSAIKGKTIGLIAPGGLEMTPKFSSNWGVHNLEDEMKHETAPAVTNCSSSKEKSCAKNCRWAIHKRRRRKLIKNFHLPTERRIKNTNQWDQQGNYRNSACLFSCSFVSNTVALPADAQWLKLIKNISNWTPNQELKDSKICFLLILRNWPCCQMRPVWVIFNHCVTAVLREVYLTRLFPKFI